MVVIVGVGVVGVGVGDCGVVGVAPAAASGSDVTKCVSKEGCRV